MELCSVLYISRSLIDPGSTAMGEILRVSRKRNAKCGVTGFLYHDRECFLQVIEGLRSDVTQIYDSIQRDTRHRNVRTLRFDKLNQRAFGDWTMGMHEGTADRGLLSERFGRDLVDSASSADAPDLLRFMRELGIGRDNIVLMQDD